MSTFRPSAGVIQQFADGVAKLMADEHRADPLGEFTVWLQMALRRESSVGQVYGIENLERRLAQVHGCPEHVELVRQTFANICAQEKGHAAYLEAILSALIKPSPRWPRLLARVEAVLGQLEGELMSSSTSSGLRQKVKAVVLLVAGKVVQDVPDFMDDMPALTLREFCLLNAELEVTAIHGYRRMLELLAQLGTQAVTGDTTLQADLERFVRDEVFHNETFVVMANWFPVEDGQRKSWLPWVQAKSQPLVALPECRAQLAAVRARVYGGEAAVVEAAPIEAPKKRASRSPAARRRPAAERQ